MTHDTARCGASRHEVHDYNLQREETRFLYVVREDNMRNTSFCQRIRPMDQEKIKENIYVAFTKKHLADVRIRTWGFGSSNLRN